MPAPAEPTSSYAGAGKSAGIESVHARGRSVAGTANTASGSASRRPGVLLPKY